MHRFQSLLALEARPGGGACGSCRTDPVQGRLRWLAGGGRRARQSLPDRAQGGLRGLLRLVGRASFRHAERCPHLGARLDGANCLNDRPLAITGLPYGHMAWDSGGLWRLGDQAAAIPSFSGDGMSIALHSAARAARSICAASLRKSIRRRLPAIFPARCGAPRLCRGCLSAMRARVSRWFAPVFFPSSFRSARASRVSQTRALGGGAARTRLSSKLTPRFLYF